VFLDIVYPKARNIPGGESPLTFTHGNLLRIVTAPPVPGIVTAVEVVISMTTSKYHPKSESQLHHRYRAYSENTEEGIYKRFSGKPPIPGGSGK